jgi:uncharacterized RDD family membrane protein YckC
VTGGRRPYLARGRDALAREIVTPEGIPLSFQLAGGGERAAAFVIDFIILIVTSLVLLWMFQAIGGLWIAAIGMVALFLLQHFYFVFFEVRWQGMTPGKKMMGIRVIDGRGGQLEASAILARNLIRYVEVWLPLGFLLAPRAIFPDAPGWAVLVAGLWILLFALMPLFNRDRLRIGDLLAGTRVVVQPKTLLVPDLADAEANRPQLPPGWGPPVPTGPTFAFTPAQLDVYGIFELQVLESVLRGDGYSQAHHEAVATVAVKIHAKIGYHAPVPSHLYETFLRDFYTALRAHLERHMLFGHRREDKHSR